MPSSGQVQLQACAGQAASYLGVEIQAGTQTEFSLVNVAGCDSTLTVFVEELIPTEANFNYAICEGESLDWNGTSLEGGTSTEFTLINSAGCDSLVTVDVDILELPSFDYFSEESCSNIENGMIELMNLQGGLPPYLISFEGSDFESLTETSFADLSSGEYLLAIQDANGCVSEQLIYVEETTPLIVSTNNPTLGCNAEAISLEVQANHQETVSYLWSNGSTESSIQVSEAAVYSVAVSNACETITTMIDVQYEANGFRDLVYIPNAFSPNDDGFNDLFKIELVDGVQLQKFDLYLFDRWGNQLYDGKNPSDGWDGQFRGSLLNDGVYIWHLEATLEYCGRIFEVEEKGDVVLLR